MADERNVIEIVLQAKDDTSAAFASLAAKMGLQKEATEALAAENKKLEDSTASLNTATKRQQVSFDDLKRSFAAGDADLADRIKLTQKLAQAYVDVERTAKKASDSQDRQNATVAQQAVANQMAARAQGALTRALRDQIKGMKDLEDEDRAYLHAEASRHAAEVRQSNETIAGNARILKSVKQRTAEEAAAAATRAQAAQKEISDTQKVIASVNQYEKAIKSAGEARQNLTKKNLSEVETINLTVKDKAALLQVELTKKAIEKTIGHLEVNMDLDTAHFDEKMAVIEAAKEILGRNVDIDIKTNAPTATAEMEAFNVAKNEAADTSALSRIGEAFGGISSAVSGSSSSVAAFDNVLRGAAAFAIAGFLQPLIMFAGAAAGALLALGSAAIYAGGALAGGLVAGLAQAIPVLGVVALAATRLMAVFKAVQQSNLAQQQQATQGATIHQTAARSANTYANALDGIRSAEEQLASAHRNVGVAETALSKARQQATRDIQDLVLAEKEAQLQAEASSLAQEGAAKALVVAVRSGGDVQQAQLDVQSANLNAQRSAVELPRAQADAATAQRQGVSGAPGVQSATRQLADAQRGVKDAETAVDRAKRSATQAGDAATLAGAKIAGAAANADYLVSKLSPVEKKLYDIAEQARKVFDTFAKEVSGPIIQATGTVVEKIIGIFQDRRIVTAMTSLSGTMAKEGLKLFSAFTNKKSIDTFLGFIKAAQTNLGPLTSILINVGKIFLDIAKAAAPTLHTLLGFFDQLTGKWATSLAPTKGKNPLTTFFTEGTNALIAFLKLGGAIVRLFLAIAGPGGGAKTGIDLLVGATGGINKLADSINKSGKAAKFFHDMFQITKDVIKDLAPLFTAIGGQLGDTFTKKGEGSVKGFVNVFAKILVPALGNFIRNLGKVTTAIGGFLDKHPDLAKFATNLIGLAASAALLKTGVSLVVGPIFAVFGALKKVFDLVGPVKDVLKVLGGVVGDVAGFFLDLAEPIAYVVEGLTGVAVPGVLIAGVLAGIAGACVLLFIKLGLIKPLFNVIVNAFKEFAKIAGPPFEDLVKQVKRLWDAFGSGKGAFAIIKPVLEFLISQVLSRALKYLAVFIGSTFAGVFKILAGAIGLVVDLLTGQWGKAWDDVKKILSGLEDIALSGIRGFLAPFGDLPKKVLKFFEKIIDDIEKFLGIASPSKKFFDMGVNLIKGLINGIVSLSKDLIDLGGKIIKWIWNGLVALAKTEFNIEKWLWTHILDGITDLASKLADLGGKIIKWIWNGLLDWAKTEFTIGEWIFNHITDGISNLVGKFGNIGKTIIDAIVAGLKAAKDDVKDALDWVIDHIPGGSLIRKGLAIVGIHLAEGGPIPGGYGGGDIVPARLEPGEHVWTKEEVRSAGGHAAMYAMRSAFGAGGQGGGGRYAVGGGVSLPNQSQIDASVTLSTDPAFKQAVKFSNDFQTLWKKLWTAIEQTTVTATNFLTKQFTTLHDNVIKLITQVNNNVTGQFDTIRKQTTQDAQDLTQSIVQSLSNLDDAVSKSMEYVGTATNQALKTFNVKPVELNVDKPPGLPGSGKAGGGWVGKPGERGQDAIATLLGRGEAVLNWGHQRIVDPALRAMYGFGLGDMFDRTNGRHAGIDGQGPHGFAKGGGGGGNVWRVRVSQEADASAFGRPGGGWTELSPNGNAAAKLGIPQDFSNSQSHYPDFATLGHLYPHGTMLKIRAPNGKSGIWPMTDIGNGSSFAPAIGLTPAVTASLGGLPAYADITMADGSDIHPFPGMATLIAGSGGFAAAGAAGAGSAFGAAVQQLKKLKIVGHGALQSLAQAAADKVVNAANKFIVSKQPVMTAAGAPGSGPLTNLVRGKPGAAGVSRYVNPDGTSPSPTPDVANWIIPILNWARQHGWRGDITSGYRPGAITTSGNVSNHAGTAWPAGAVDVGDADAAPQGLELWNVVKRYPGEPKLYSAAYGPRSWVGYYDSAHVYHVHDYGHFSGTGHAKGGFAGIAQQWEMLKRARGGYAGSYDVGGELPGSPGQPIPIIAHAQEWVVNKGQQSKIANWLGTSRDQLKGALGFTGGPTSFAGGGQPTSSRSPVTASNLNLSNLVILLNAIAPSNVAGFGPILVRLNTALRKFGDKAKDFFAGINTLSEQDGIFDQLSATIDARLAQMQSGLALAQSGLRRITRGGVTRLVRRPVLNVTQSDQRDLAVSAANVAALEKERGEMTGELQKVNKQLADATKGTKVYTDLLGARNKFLADLDSTDQKIAQARADQFTKQQALFQQQTTNALRGTTVRLARADVTSRVGAALENDSMIKKAGDQQVVALIEQKKVLQKRADEAAAKAKRDPRYQQTADDLAQQVRDTTASIAEAQATAVQNAQTAFQNQLDKALRPSAQRQQFADLANRIGSALGNTDIVSAASNVQISALQQQQKVLQNKYNDAAAKAAKDPRWQQVADDLSSQLSDTTASIVEAQATALQNQVDTINNNVARQQSSVDIANRIADIQEKMGDPVGAAQARLRNMQATGGILSGQVGGLTGLLGAAQTQGNIGLVQTLTDQIADLNTQIAENTAAMSDQTVAVRQATLDQINNRAQFQTGVFGGLGTLVAAVATNLNIDTSQQQETLLQQTFQALQDQFSQLASALFSGFGVNLMGLSGTDFASAVSQLNFSALESGMTQAQQGQFEGLIQALIDTQNALASNTTQLDTLTGTLGQAQSFSSTAWQVLRMAVFTGAGGLLPQFQIPSMQSGGYVSKSGIFNLHAGEFVVNPSHPGGQQIGNGDVNVTVHEAGPETDYTYLANRIAFATRTPST